MPIWDRTTGAVDAEVARAWEKYDIRLQLEKNWKTLGPKLSGKIHVYTGGEDTLLSRRGGRAVEAPQKELGSDAVIGNRARQGPRQSAK